MSEQFQAPEGYTPVAYVQRSNGAWLVSASTTAAVDRPAHENFAAASGLARAKRVALELVEEDCSGSGHRWERRGETWVLWMKEAEWTG